MPAILTGLAPEVVLAFGLLAVLASYFLARGLIYIWEYTFGGLLRGIARILPGGWSLFGHTIVPSLKGAFLGLESAVFRSLQNWAEGAEQAIAGIWHAMTAVWKWNAGIAEWLAKETAHTLDWLITVRMPKWLQIAVGVAFPAGYLTRLIAAQVKRLVTQPVKLIKVIEHAVPQKVVQVFKITGAAVLPGVLGIPRIWDQIHGLTKRMARIHWRLRRLEALLTAAGLAAVMAKVLGVSTRCLRRGNAGQALRRVCGMDASLLEDLLAGTLAIVGAVSIVEFAEDLRAIEDEAVGIMGALVREWPS